MVIKIFEVPECGSGAGDGQMERWRAMGRKWNMIRFAQGCYLRKTGETATARHIGLQDIDRTTCQHFPEIIQIVSVFTCGDLNVLRRVDTNKSQTIEVV